MAKRFRFIHCADLHLGTPLAIREAPSRYWEKTLRDATFQAFRNIVDTAIEKRVAAIVIAGDVYNSADHSLPAQLEFSRELCGYQHVYRARQPRSGERVAGAGAVAADRACVQRGQSGRITARGGK